MNEITRAIAHQVRTSRRDRGLSGAELARMAGLSKATLSALEAGRGNPTVDTVWALAQALGVPIGALMRTHDEPSSTRVVRRGDGDALTDSVLNVRLLAQPNAATRIEILTATIRGPDPRHSAAHAPGTVEHIFLRDGHLRVGPETEPVELHAGDYASFPGHTPHVYCALSTEAEALILIAHPVGTPT